MISVIVSVVAALGAVAAATGFYAAGVGVVVALPWWLALAGPVTLYAVLALLGVSDVPVAARASVFGALCGVHAVLVAAMAAAFTFVAPVGYLDALSSAVLSFFPVPLIPVTAAPLILLPFRGLLAPPPRPVRPALVASMDQRAVRRAEPRTEASPVAPPPLAAPRPAVMPGGTSGAMAARSASASPFASAFRSAAPAPAPVVEDRSAAPPEAPDAVEPEPQMPEPELPAPVEPEPMVIASRAPAPMPAPLPASVVEPTLAAEPGVAETVTAEPPAIEPPAPPPEVVPVPVAVVEPALEVAAPGPAVQEALAALGDDYITIPLERIADQLPAEAFTQPVTGLAGSLPEPGRLRIARSRVVRQLPNGVVRVGWADIAGQLPREARSLGDDEIASRIGTNGIVLPLDEVIRALPPEVLSLSSTTPDLVDLESFPLPFQPPPPPPPTAVKDAGALGTPAVGAQAVETERLEREVTARLGGADELERAPVLPASPPNQAVERDPTPPAAPSSPPSSTSQARPAASPDPRMEQETHAAEPVSIETEAARLAASLTLLGGVEVGVGRVDGDGCFTVMAGGLTADAVAATVRPLLPLLDGNAAPWPVEQITVRRDKGAILLTPLGGAGLLAASVTRDFRLALVEMRCREAAASGAAAFAKTGEMPRRQDEAPSLTAVAGGPAAELLARSMSAFGPLTLTVLRGEPALELCLLLPPGDDARTIGRFVWAALDLARDAEAGRLDSIEIRFGARRLLLRPTDTPGRFTALGLHGDAAHRTGWAHVQMLHATARLEAA
ncbi:MAG TPA: hypothetical protein VML54_13810 [Candidatus Limnocylindrales bacterium]|nr:hypothetical protein [Candidatus Limnocylindrales bacterium]